MRTARQVSDDEVSFAIRYLDPDLTEHSTWRGVWQHKATYWAKVAGVGLLIALCFYFTLLRWLPVLVRLAN